MSNLDLSPEAVERVIQFLDGLAKLKRGVPLHENSDTEAFYLEQAAALLRALVGEREAKWRCDWPGCTNTERHGHAGMSEDNPWRGIPGYQYRPLVDTNPEAAPSLGDLLPPPPAAPQALEETAGKR